MITAASSTAQAFTYWHLTTGFLPEIILLILVVFMTIGVATKFMRGMARHDGA